MCLGIPGQIVEVVSTDFQLAKVDVGGIRRVISIALLQEEESDIQPGDWVLIHVGFAMSRIDEARAQETLQALETMGEMYTDEVRAIRESLTT